MPGLPGLAGLDGQKVSVCSKVVTMSKQQEKKWVTGFCSIVQVYLFIYFFLLKNKFSFQGEPGLPGSKGAKGSSGPPVCKHLLHYSHILIRI